MNEDIEILKFEETPDQKFLGVATVRLFRAVVLRYKVVEKNDGSGYFITAPSYKREFEDGSNKWTVWHMLDSQVFSEEVQDQIRAYVNKLTSSKGANQQSAFSQPSQVMQGQSDDVPF